MFDVIVIADLKSQSRYLYHFLPPVAMMNFGAPCPWSSANVKLHKSFFIAAGPSKDFPLSRVINSLTLAAFRLSHGSNLRSAQTHRTTTVAAFALWGMGFKCPSNFGKLKAMKLDNFHRMKLSFITSLCDKLEDHLCWERAAWRKMRAC